MTFALEGEFKSVISWSIISFYVDQSINLSFADIPGFILWLVYDSSAKNINRFKPQGPARAIIPARLYKVRF
jgi:hypothetical protein